MFSIFLAQHARKWIMREIYMSNVGLIGYSRQLWLKFGSQQTKYYFRHTFEEISPRHHFFSYTSCFHRLFWCKIFSFLFPQRLLHVFLLELSLEKWKKTPYINLALRRSYIYLIGWKRSVRVIISVMFLLFFSSSCPGWGSGGKTWKEHIIFTFWYPKYQFLFEQFRSSYGKNNSIFQIQGTTAISKSAVVFSCDVSSRE